MKKIILLDMDGTLTPARGEMSRVVAEKLFMIHNSGFHIGIISGSGLNYILDQCRYFFTTFGSRLDRLMLYPCNGTKYYNWNFRKNEVDLVYKSNIRSEIGHNKLKNILNSLLTYQLDLMNNYEFSNRLNYTGTFIDYRDSIINWCPIGRNANESDRAMFEELDKYYGIRNLFSKTLLDDSAFNELSIKIGGATSFDIYPHGWDKTYALCVASENSMLLDFDELYFIGDRCQPRGNDYEVYEYIKKINPNNSFETNGPNETIEILDILKKR